MLSNVSLAVVLPPVVAAWGIFVSCLPNLDLYELGQRISACHIKIKTSDLQVDWIDPGPS